MRYLFAGSVLVLIVASATTGVADIDLDRLKDPKPDVRQDAAWSVAEALRRGDRTSSEGLAEPLLKMLEEKNEKSETAAVVALSAIRYQPEKLLPRLKGFLETRGQAGKSRRLAAPYALPSLGPFAPKLAQQVAACLDGDDDETSQALYALRPMGGKSAVFAADRVIARNRCRKTAVPYSGECRGNAL